MATEYIIFKGETDRPGMTAWVEIGRAKASGATTAAREIVPKPEVGVEYLAVPVSNATFFAPKVRERAPVVDWKESEKPVAASSRRQEGSDA